MSSADSTPPWLTLVGIGEDGYPGLGKQARRALLHASRIVGAARQLELLPPCIGAARETWPTPFSTGTIAGPARLAGLQCWPAATRCCSASAPVSPGNCRRPNCGSCQRPPPACLAAARLGWSPAGSRLPVAGGARWRRCEHSPRRPAPAGPQQRRRQPRPPSPTPVERPWLRRQSPERAGTPRQARSSAVSTAARRRLKSAAARPPISTWWRWNAAPAPAPCACC